MRRLPPTAMAGLALLVLSASLAQAAPAPVTGAVICHGVTPRPANLAGLLVPQAPGRSTSGSGLVRSRREHGLIFAGA